MAFQKLIIQTGRKTVYAGKGELPRWKDNVERPTEKYYHIIQVFSLIPEESPQRLLINGFVSCRKDNGEYYPPRSFPINLILDDRCKSFLQELAQEVGQQPTGERK